MTVTATQETPTATAPDEATAASVLAQLNAAGIRLRIEDGKLTAYPREAITDELRALMRAHKAALRKAIAKPPLPAPAPPLDVAAEARRSRVLAMLSDRQATRYAVLTDAEADPEAVILALAIRGAMADGSTVTCELRIPREKYDPAQLMHLIERHGATVH